LGGDQHEESYLHASECVNSIFLAIEKSTKNVNIFDIGSENTMILLEIKFIKLKGAEAGSLSRYQKGTCEKLREHYLPFIGPYDPLMSQVIDFEYKSQFFLFHITLLFSYVSGLHISGPM